MTIQQPLSPEQATAMLPDFIDELGKTNQQRLNRLLEILDGEIALIDALQYIYPDQTQKQAEVNFRKMRQDVNKVAAEAGSGFRLETDGNTRLPIEINCVWQLISIVLLQNLM